MVTSATSGWPAARPTRTRLPTSVTESTRAEIRFWAESSAVSGAGRIVISHGYTLSATRPVPASVVVATPPPSRSTTVSPSCGARTVPVSTTAPVKSATNALAGAAASSLAVPRWMISPASMTPISSPSSAASEKSWVTSSDGSSSSWSVIASSRAALARVRGSRADRGSSSKQHGGRRRERPSEGDALSLSAGELVGAGVGPVGQPEALEQLERGGAPLAAWTATEPVRDVAPRAQVGEQRVVLEHVAAAPAFRWRPDPRRRVDPHLLAERNPAPVWTNRPGDEPQDRRLARTGWAGERETVARLNGERHPEPNVSDVVREFSFKHG